MIRGVQLVASFSISKTTNSIRFKAAEPAIFTTNPSVLYHRWRTMSSMDCPRSQWSTCMRYQTGNGGSSTTKSNRELAEERIQAYRAKREARQKSIESANERNYELKLLLHGGDSSVKEDDLAATSGSPMTPNATAKALYQIKVIACEELRQSLKLSGREKRGRVFVDASSPAVSQLSALKSELHAFFRALRKDSYLLYGGYPTMLEDGTVVASIMNPNNGTAWPIATDEDVALTFQRTNDFFESQSSSSILKRPAIVIYVKKNPNLPPPPPPPPYLMNMPNPADSTHMTMLSFYSFPVGGIADPNEYAVTLRKLWRPFQALGRVYVAQEGVNAQMSVPTLVLPNFRECCNSLPDGVGNYLCQNGGINVDPVPLTRDEFAVAGLQAAAAVSMKTEGMGGPSQPTPPFSNLHIRVRQQIVADGLDKSYDWQNAGKSM
jgi:UPF0176 acylphosphatase like domain